MFQNQQLLETFVLVCLGPSPYLDVVAYGPTWMLLLTVIVLVGVTYTRVFAFTVISAPALMLVCTFMPRPPYEVVMVMVLVTGLRPLKRGVTIEVSL